MKEFGGAAPPTLPSLIEMIQRRDQATGRQAMTSTTKHPNARRRHGQTGPTEKMREYLEVIYYLSARNEPVIGARLAEWMNVTPPTVTNIVQRMEEQGYITRDGRGDIR